MSARWRTLYQVTVFSPNSRAEAEGITAETIIAEVLRAIPEDAIKK